MRNLFKKIVVWKLDHLAKIYLWRFKPEIIAVTGNVGKTSTKEAIACVLKKVKRVRSGKGNLNNEFGVPLTILGDWSDDYYEAGNSGWFWFRVFMATPFGLFSRNYPEVLVLEYGADRPGDIARLAEKYKPKIGIITAVGEIPVHIEYFSDPDGLAKEKSKLISKMDSSCYAILNHDDPAVYDMKERTKARVMSYGFTAHLKDKNTDVTEDSMNLGEAMVKLSNLDFRFDSDGRPMGIGFKIHHGNNASFVPVILHDILGRSQALAAGAAAAVGIIYGMNLIEISQALVDYQGPKGRLKILKGIKNSTIIDDTYNAAPSSMHLAIDTLKDLVALRRAQGKTTRSLVVLGDMLELGKYTVQAHQEIGNLVGGHVDVLVTVGLRAKFIADSAENQMSKENIYSFTTSDLAKIKIQELIEEGDLILVKGSQGARMEKIVEEIMAEPERKRELLVRQGKKWLKN